MEMDTTTASLERSLQNCSLNGHSGNHVSNTPAAQGSGGMGIGRSSSSDDVGESRLANPDTTLELNSHISLPQHWEQCLDLKTGEIYYINWSTGMKAKEDPRLMRGEYEYSEDDSSREYDSEESSSESSPGCSSKEPQQQQQQQQQQHQTQMEKQNVLVVAGCKGCLMYLMVPKTLEDCPKCSGQLLHFDRQEN